MENSHHNLDNLPDLVYYYILKNLDINGLWSLKVVNKRLYSFVKNFNIIELSLVNFKNHSNGFDNWFSTTKSIRPGYLFDIKTIKSIHLSKTTNLLNLKYLRLGHPAKLLKLDPLNRYKKLQILEAHFSFNKTSNHLLQLPDLKALRIFVGKQSSQDSLVIDTPNLHSLSIEYYDAIGTGIEFIYPNSVKYLHVFCFRRNQHSIFINLECLEMNVDRGFEVDDLLIFNNLKKLKFTNSTWYNDKAKNLFRSKRDELQLILHGVRIKEVNKIDEYFNRSDLEFQLNNYSELEDDLNFVRRIQYNQLICLLPNQPSDLFAKYTNIQELEIDSKIEDENRLVNFIRRCPNLKNLYITRSSLSQTFYDQLPAIKLLTNLSIFDNQEDLNLNFEFIMKMSNLCEFITDRDVLISIQLNLNSFKCLTSFNFSINNRQIKIRKEDKDKYELIMNKPKFLNSSNQKYVDHNGLIKRIDQFRNMILCMRETRSMSRKRKLSIQK